MFSFRQGCANDNNGIARRAIAHKLNPSRGEPHDRRSSDYRRSDIVHGMKLQYSLATLLVCMTVLAVLFAASVTIPVADTQDLVTTHEMPSDGQISNFAEVHNHQPISLRTQRNRSSMAINILVAACLSYFVDVDFSPEHKTEVQHFIAFSNLRLFSSCLCGCYIRRHRIRRHQSEMGTHKFGSI